MSSDVLKDVTMRGNYLIYSLLNETLTSYFLSKLLNIENHKESKTLGNKSSAFSFNQKVDLLMDMQVLKRDDKNKFQTFMEIRNQFMHNVEAATYEKCFTFLPDGKDKWLLKTYPQPKTSSREVALKDASISLAKDVFELITGIVQALENKKSQQNNEASNKRKIDSYQKAVLDIEKIVELEIVSLIGKQKTISKRKIKELGKRIRLNFEKTYKNYRLESIKTIARSS